MTEQERQEAIAFFRHGLESGIFPGARKAYTAALEALEKYRDWIPFKPRALTDEEEEYMPEWECIFEGPIPADGDEVLVTDGEWVGTDIFNNSGYPDSCYFKYVEIADMTAWMPYPEPYKPELVTKEDNK